MNRFEGKSALLTGAASGIGRAVSVRLASEGARVFAIDINADGLAETASLVTDAGGQATTRVVDVSDREACFAAVAAAVEAHGGLDVLGNIAGIAAAHHVTEVSEAEYRRMMGVNLDGPFFLSQAAIPHLLESDGNIVNIASNAGLMGQAYTVPYCMTKGGVVQLTRALSWEYIKTSMRVNAIAPGGTNTALANGFSIPEDVDFELMARYQTPRGMTEATDIASVFAFLASDDARSVHGAIVSADFAVTAG